MPLLAGPSTSGGRATRPATRRQWLGVAAVACIGGSVPFVLFFEGLARADATQAAFIHKTLVVWVALLAIPLLRERLGPAHLAAIGLVLAGQAWLAGGLGTVVFGAGETMIPAATLLWAVEDVLVKRLLDVLAPRTPRRRGWRWGRSFSSVGSRSRAASATCSRWALSSGAGPP